MAPSVTLFVWQQSAVKRLIIFFYRRNKQQGAWRLGIALIHSAERDGANYCNYQNTKSVIS